MVDIVTPLVTLEAAKARLKVYHTDEDDDITSAVLQASAIVLDYIGKPDGSTLSATQVLCAQAATLNMTAALWNGEDDEGKKYDPAGQASGLLPRKVVNLLHRIRDPSLA